MTRRNRVALSAFACRPGSGSEPGAGWAWARAAAQIADVVLLTERANEPYVRAALATDPLPSLRPVYVDLPRVVARWSTEDDRIRLRHALWQLAARREVRRLHAAQPFDVVHHLTWSADWQPVGMPALPGARFVWGPAGGAAPLPWRLRRWLTPAAMVGELARCAAGAAGRRAFGDAAARRADVVLCMNREVAERFAGSPGRVVLEPHVALDRAELARVEPSVEAPRTAVFVGRLLDWKGVRLAVATIARPECADWRLVVLGTGPARAGLLALAAELGAADRVELVGHVPRQQALARMAGADALLFPSMHDSCGWVVAEALSLGTPVVCLDVCGPPVLVGRAGGGRAVPVTRDPLPALARALGEVRTEPLGVTDAFDAGRLVEVLRTVYGIPSP